MAINDEELTKILNDFCNHDFIQFSDIPDIYLYMDQVTTFFDDKFDYYKRKEDDKIFTKTMINNYTNANILFPSDKKKYNKQHVLILILVYHLKQVLSISDIQKLLTPITNDEEIEFDNKVKNIDNLYSVFMELEKAELEEFKLSFKNKIEQIKEKLEISDINNAESEKTDLILLVLLLVVQANIRKTIAEKIIDQYLDEVESK